MIEDEGFTITSHCTVKDDPKRPGKYVIEIVLLLPVDTNTEAYALVEGANIDVIAGTAIRDALSRGISFSKGHGLYG